MLATVALVQVVTLYCSVTLSTNMEPPEPTAQRVFTVDYDSGQIFVVAGDREGEVLQARSITPTTIQFPDFTTADSFSAHSSDARSNGTERIDRTTGAYEARKSVRLGRMPGLDFHYRGSCEPGLGVPFPEVRF